MIGQFISFEGPDGAGKTSVLTAITEQLQQIYDKRIIITREPGGNRISESIRNFILDPQNAEIDYRTEALLYAASRRQTIKKTILPALKAGNIVICDRFIDSSVAYQGAGRQIGEQVIYDMNLFATNGLMPEKTLYFDVPSEVGLARIKSPLETVDRLDIETLAFHHRVRESYLRMMNCFPERIIKIDATQTFDKVIIDTLSKLNNIII